MIQSLTVKRCPLVRGGKVVKMEGKRRTITGSTRQDRYLVSPTRGAKMGGGRDSQRSRVYQSEREALGSPAAPNPIPRDEAIRFIREIERSRWFREGGMTPEQRLAANEWHVTITGRGSRSAAAWPKCWEVRLPATFCHRWVIVHEMAHLIAAPITHGPEWVGLYLDGLVSVGLVNEAASLADRFRANGVRSSRPLSDYGFSETLFDPDLYGVVAA